MSYTGETEYNNRITMAYALLSSISQEAYKHPFLLSNQVLSKNPFTTNFLARYLDRENPAMPSRLMVLAKLAKYYLLSLRDLISYVKEFAEYYLSGLRFRHPENKSELVLIDMPFLVSKLNNPGVLPDSFFPGLASFLEKNKMNYAYLPVFDGMKKIFEFHGILSGLRKNKAQILCEYQLLGSGDLFKILYFILVYPIEVIRLARSLDTNDFGRRLVRYELLDTLSQPAFRAFSRYCQGRSIAGLPYEKIKVISWYENQAIHKNLYKGLRIRSEKVAIYGAQLFIYSRNQLNIIPDENEAVFGVVPDKIIVNGTGFLPSKAKLNYSIGPSLRYAKMFNGLKKMNTREKVLVLLPYFEDDINNILRTLANFQKPVFIKFHPATDIDRFKCLVAKNAEIVIDDIYKLFEGTKILIGAASGTLLEAASLGIPVISVKNTGRFECNPLPAYGKGVIWEESAGEEELKRQISLFERALINDPSQIETMAMRYKKDFFCEPTEENIKAGFDL